MREVGGLNIVCFHRERRIQFPPPPALDVHLADEFAVALLLLLSLKLSGLIVLVKY